MAVRGNGRDLANRHFVRLRLGSFNHAASESGPGIPGRISFQIVLFFMNDHGFADDRIFAAQIQFSFPNQMPFARTIGFDVAEITGVTLRPRRPVVVLMRRVEMGAG